VLSLRSLPWVRAGRSGRRSAILVRKPALRSASPRRQATRLPCHPTARTRNRPIRARSTTARISSSAKVRSRNQQGPPCATYGHARKNHYAGAYGRPGGVVYTEDARRFRDCSMFKGQPRARSKKKYTGQHADRLERRDADLTNKGLAGASANPLRGKRPKSAL